MNEGKLAHREIIQKFISSPIQYWMGHAANYSLVVFMIHRAWRYASELSLAAWILIPLLGLFVWTLAEYLLHRGPFHNVASASSTGHLLHHEDPEGLLGTPFYLNMALMLAIYFAASWITGSPASVGLFIGFFWLGHVAYSWVHHGVHHWNLKSKWFVELKRHHKIHHAKPEYNFGVTTMFWDRVFQTSLVKPSALSNIKESA